MEIRFHKKLYRDGISDRKLASFQKKIRKKSPKIRCFLVTFPLGAEGLLEIYWYPELLQQYYQKMDTELVVVGVAMDRESAFHLVEQIISDVGFDKGNLAIKEYFRENE